MSDLDDEELEATRRLNGVAREKDKERTDINVGNIKKDIKRCEQLIKPEHANWIGISNQLAIAHLIERVKELEADLYIADYKIESYIPIEKINNQIDKYKHMLELTTYGEPQKYTPGEIILKINTLEESLSDAN